MKEKRQIYLLLLTGLLLSVSLFISAYNPPEDKPTSEASATATETQALTQTPGLTPTLESSPTATLQITSPPTLSLTPLSSPVPSATATQTGTLATAITSSQVVSRTPSITPTPTSTPVSRQEVITHRGVYHKWSLVYWATNGTACVMFLDANTPSPSLADVLKQCGPTVYWQWYNSDACNEAHLSDCKGLYLSDGGLTDAVVTTRQMRPIEVNMEIRCDQVDLNGMTYCMTQPFLIVTALDTKSGAWIKTIQIEGLSGKNQVCEDKRCEVALPDNASDSQVIGYWAISSLGDSSTRHVLTFRVRQMTTRPKFWQVTLGGDQLGDSPLINPIALAAEWLSLPPEDLPYYLAVPENVQELNHPDRLLLSGRDAYP